MKKKTLLPIFILVIVAVSSTYAYTNFCVIKNSQVYISSSNVTINDSTVSIGNNVTFVNPPNSIAPHDQTQAPEQAPSTLKDAAMGTYTFTVYRWRNGNVDLSLLNEYAMWRMTVPMPVLFTYRLENSSGMAAYWHMSAQGFSLVTSEFETDLAKATAQWAKTEETVEIPMSFYAGAPLLHPECAYLFP